MNKESLNILVRLYFILILVVCFPISILISLIYSLQNSYVGHTIYNALKILSIFAIVLLVVFLIVGLVKYIKNKK